MKKYLSFGGGVNSVAMMLMLLDQGDEFEAIFVDHETDYPETYEYFDMFQEYLRKLFLPQITVLKPDVGTIEKKRFKNLYDYYFFKRISPSIFVRSCTDKFKVTPVQKYVRTPCFMLIGIDAGEAKRAKISMKKGIENRYPLIEQEIDRQGCKDIIKSHGLPIPVKSGCYVCPFQRKDQWIELRKKHPDLFCKAVQMEETCKKRRMEEGKKPLTLSPTKKSLSSIVDENQLNLFEQDNYPPCECGL